jgi:hypothetical protein
MFWQARQLRGGIRRVLTRNFFRRKTAQKHKTRLEGRAGVPASRGNSKTSGNVEFPRNRCSCQAESISATGKLRLNFGLPSDGLSFNLTENLCLLH